MFFSVLFWIIADIVHTYVLLYGFGYSLDSVLLNELTIKGCDSYFFIPDISFVGTIFVNAASNLCANVARNVESPLNVPNDSSLIVLSNFKHAVNGEKVKIDLGSAMYGQNKTVMIKFYEDDEADNNEKKNSHNGENEGTVDTNIPDDRKSGDLNDVDKNEAQTNVKKLIEDTSKDNPIKSRDNASLFAIGSAPGGSYGTKDQSVNVKSNHSDNKSINSKSCATLLPVFHAVHCLPHVVLLRLDLAGCDVTDHSQKTASERCYSYTTTAEKTVLALDEDALQNYGLQDLYNNIVCSGGTTMFEDTEEILQKEIKALTPHSRTIKIIAPPWKENVVYGLMVQYYHH